MLPAADRRVAIRAQDGAQNVVICQEIRRPQAAPGFRQQAPQIVARVIRAVLEPLVLSFIGVIERGLYRADIRDSQDPASTASQALR